MSHVDALPANLQATASGLPCTAAGATHDQTRACSQTQIQQQQTPPTSVILCSNHTVLTDTLQTTPCPQTQQQPNPPASVIFSSSSTSRAALRSRICASRLASGAAPSSAHTSSYIGAISVQGGMASGRRAGCRGMNCRRLQAAGGMGCKSPSSAAAGRLGRLQHAAVSHHSRCSFHKQQPRQARQQTTSKSQSNRRRRRRRSPCCCTRSRISRCSRERSTSATSCVLNRKRCSRGQ